MCVSSLTANIPNRSGAIRSGGEEILPHLLVQDHPRPRVDQMPGEREIDISNLQAIEW